jgi:hypothetical protein
MPKPTSGTSLDTGNSLYTNLSAAWAFLEGSGLSSADSVAGTYDLTLISSASLFWGTDDAGDTSLIFDVPETNPVRLANDLVLDGSVDWSLAFRISQKAEDTKGMFIGDGAQQAYVFLNGSGNYLRVRNAAGVQIFNYDVTAIDTTLDDDWVITYTQTSGTSGDYALYLNGVQVATDSGSGDLGNIDRIGNGATSSNFALAGSISYIYAWVGRALVLADAAALASDPYSVFESVNSVSVTPDSRIWQRSGTGVSVGLGGGWAHLSGDAVEVRILRESDDVEIVGWTEVDSTLSGSTWSGSVTVPTGGPYYAQARLLDSGDSVLVSSTDSDTFLVGDIFANVGQSNARGKANNGQVYTGAATAWTSQEDGTVEDLQDPWSSTTELAANAGSYGPLATNLLDNLLGGTVPIIWLVSAYVGKAISNWAIAGPQWVALTGQISNANPNAIKGIIWLQGESDASGSVGGYEAAEAELVPRMNAFPGSPEVMSALINHIDLGDPADVKDVNEGKQNNWANGVTLRGPNPISISLGDGTHYATDAQISQLAALWFFCIADEWYGTSYGRSPKVVNVRSDFDEFCTITFHRDLDTDDTTYGAAAFEIDNDDGAARTIVSATRSGSRQVIVECSGALDGTAPKLSFGNAQLAYQLTIPKTTPIALPETINSLSEMPLFAEPFYDEPIEQFPAGGSSNGLVSGVDSSVARGVAG